MIKVKTRTKEIVFDLKNITAALEKVFLSEIVAAIDAAEYREYICIMKKLGWPAFFNFDSAFHTLIIYLFNHGHVDDIEPLLFEWYDRHYFVDLKKRISESAVIRKDRLASLSEALLLYQRGYYYGAVAIITPQLVGLVSDLNLYMKNNALVYNPANLKEIEQGCGISLSLDIGLILAAILEGKDLDDEPGGYDSLSSYMRFKVYNNKMSSEDTAYHVSRHLFSHGVQVNYGTRRHALRIIMCLDALVWITQVISTEYSL